MTALELFVKLKIMKQENIMEIAISKKGKLQVKPSSEEFPFIYRAAMGVYWDEDGKFFKLPHYDSGEYLNHFNFVVDAAKSEYGIVLKITNETNWVNIPNDLKIKIQEQYDQL